METKAITRKSLFALALAGFMTFADSAIAWPKGSISSLPHSSNKRVAWTVDDGERMRALQAMGVDAITSNHPELFARLG